MTLRVTWTLSSPVYEAVRVNVGNLEAACVFVLVPFL